MNWFKFLKFADTISNFLETNSLQEKDFQILRDSAKRQEISLRLQNNSYTVNNLIAENKDYCAKQQTQPITFKPQEQQATLARQWQNVNPDIFLNAVSRSNRSSFLSHLSPEDLKGYKLILQNVFNNGQKGGGRTAVIQSVKHGGRTLDCFEDFLPDYYSQFGFVETGRMKFNREFAPKNWNYEQNGEPDVVFMSLKGDLDEQRVMRNLSQPRAKWVRDKVEPIYYNSWDEAKNASRNFRGNMSEKNSKVNEMDIKTAKSVQDLKQRLTSDEFDILSLVARNKGWEHAIRFEKFIFEQANSVGEL
jgi:hypothetical protein